MLHRFVVVFILLAQNICCNQSALLPPSALSTANFDTRQSNISSNKTRSVASAWPPNLQHFDIWNVVETPADVVEHAAEDDLEGLLLQNSEGFQYAGNNMNAEILNIKSNDDTDEELFVTAGIKRNETNQRQKASVQQNRSAILDTIEKHLENKTILDVPNERQNRVIHLFPVPVDGECLSEDGRRTGSCFNIYECRAKGGLAKGDCAMGFGVCCIFIADCNTTISNNITYLLSPQFPSFMPNNYSTPCSFKIALMDSEVSQLRIDFYHFSMSQPNRRTGVCDSDVFSVSGGPSGTLTICGQNSGQHIYYEVGGAAAPRQTLYGNLRPLTFSQLFPNISNNGTPVIEINMNFTQRFQPIRLWEIRIAQIPFSQRAPVGCLQYHTGTEGIIQTFNFAENGRHLANQNYRICMRQEQNMCSIMYQPCDEQSFRIGPSMAGEQGVLNMGAPIMMMDPMLVGAMGGTMGTDGGVADVGDNPAIDFMSTMQSPVLADDADMVQTMDTATTAMMSSATVTSTAADTMDSSTTAVSSDGSAATMSTEAASSSAAPAGSTEMSSAAPIASETPAASSEAPAGSSSATTVNIRSSTTPSTPSSSTLSDEISDEGSGGGDADWVAGAPNRRPGPVGGGFDILGFLRSAFDFTGELRSGRQVIQVGQSSRDSATLKEKGRQLYSRCTDRITMPCIVEDFIGMGPLGSPTLPGCEPVHCGSQFCASGVWPCRIESTVTPFYVGVHFGSGAGKGSAEDNIGACLRYQQIECM